MAEFITGSNWSNLSYRDVQQELAAIRSENKNKKNQATDDSTENENPQK